MERIEVSISFGVADGEKYWDICLLCSTTLSVSGFFCSDMIASQLSGVASAVA